MTAPDDVAGPRPFALSPSRAADLRRCPLQYRLRAIDRLPEPPSAAALRGTLVHRVLEQMFGLPPGERTPRLVAALVGPAWEELRSDDGGGGRERAGPVPDFGRAFLASAESLVLAYFTLEDPRRFTPQACEVPLEVVLPGGARLRGIADRVDISADGRLRIVDYKSGAAPRQAAEAAALSQLKFYALMILQLREVVPSELVLLYLRDRTPLRIHPDALELQAFSRTVGALWSAVTAAVRTGAFTAVPGPGCRWCAFRDRCPAWGGTPPTYPGPPAGVGLR